jgi:DNA-binding MarR family transcriptional regulator
VLDAPPGATLQFMQRLWAVDHGLQSRSKRMLATLGVTGPQRLVLRMLGRTPGLSAGELAAVLHLHPSTLTGILQRLEHLGLVSRTTAAADRRRVVLRLTTAGRSIDRARAGTVESAVRATLQRASPAAVATTIGVLSQLVLELDREATRSARTPTSSRGRR